MKIPIKDPIRELEEIEKLLPDKLIEALKRDTREAMKEVKEMQKLREQRKEDWLT